MVIAIFGESCVGKSTIAKKLSQQISATVFTGKDYVRLAKHETEAKEQFITLLQSNEMIIYVISEKEHLSLLPERAVRVLVTAELGTIKQRFAKRMNGQLPAPVAAMIEKKHGCFHNERYDLHVENPEGSVCDICNAILRLCGPSA